MFDNLKKESFPTLGKRKTAPRVYFVLRHDKNGSFIHVCDKELEPLEVNPKLYSNSVSKALDFIQNIIKNQLFSISWEKNSSVVYLHEYPQLLILLQDVDHLVDEKGVSVHFTKGVRKTILHLEVHQNKIHPTFNFSNGGIWLNDTMILMGDEIVSVEAVGKHFTKIEQFTVAFDREDLEQYLCLVFSFFTNIDVNYQNFTVMMGDELICKEALMIQEVDKESNLYLKTLDYIDNVDTAFLNSYDLNHVVFINDVEGTVNIHPFIKENASTFHSKIITLLNGYKKECNESYFIQNDTFIIEPTLASLFLKESLGEIIASHPVIGTPKLKAYKIQTVQPKLKLSSASWGVDFLSASATLEILNQVFTLHEALNMYKKEGYIQLSGGENVVVQKEYFDTLERLIKKEQDNSKISFFDMPEVATLIDDKANTVLFKKSEKLYDGFNMIGRKAPSLEINATLRTYQSYGVNWLLYLYNNDMGGCLADDMGLGKTLQTIGLLSEIVPKATKPVLVVMPKSLLYNWQKELEKFAPNLPFSLYYGAKRNYEQSMKSPLVLTSYAIVRNDIALFETSHFDTVILDESQVIKNASSHITKAILLLKADHRFALSGTPIENALSELFVLFKFLNPAMFYSASDFNKHYVVPIQKQGNKQALESLRKKIYPFILRRLKMDVAKDLPPKTEQVLYVEMNEQQATFYEQRRAYYEKEIANQVKIQGVEKSQFFVLQALSELRQIASNPEVKTDGTIHSSKMQRMIQSLQESVANNHKVLIFTNYLDVLDQISDTLKHLGISHLTMSGSTSNRQVLVDDFQNDETIKVFAMTLKVGGVGLTLTKADVVYIFDPWWNKTAENQAIDRTHRIGQTNPVTAYKLIAKDSIEEKILELQEKKSDLFDALIGTDSASTKALSADDIAFLLGK